MQYIGAVHGQFVDHAKASLLEGFELVEFVRLESVSDRIQVWQLGTIGVLAPVIRVAFQHQHLLACIGL